MSDTAQNLYSRFLLTANRLPEKTAFVDPEHGKITYRELKHQAEAFSALLREHEVQRGDRVGIFVKKSTEAIAALLGTIRIGAIYVPVDPIATIRRAGLIFSDCKAKVILVEKENRNTLEQACRENLHSSQWIESRNWKATTTIAPASLAAVDSPAYILYTSGSTGIPKGVVLSHKNGDSFISWCVNELKFTESDRFSMHAPFHFDLSVLDIHATIRVGGTGIIIASDVGKNPRLLFEWMTSQEMTVWYSTPSILNMLVEFADWKKGPAPKLRTVLFAGEEYPIAQLIKLTQKLPTAKYFNLYGPTETNVCTFFPVPIPIPEGRTTPFPIGYVCSNDKAKLDTDLPDQELKANEGELLIRGDSVMLGYWNRPETNEKCFYIDEKKQAWYRTGDIVRKEQGDCFIYLGRRDRMVKRRGYRIEPGEIENALQQNQDIDRAVVIPKKNETGEVQLIAFLKAKKQFSIIELREYCAKVLPIYMVPDRFIFLEEIPMTSTSKTDYQKLKELCP